MTSGPQENAASGSRPTRRLKVGILGCGAIVEQQRLREAQGVQEIEIRALVDSDIDRARTLAEQYDVAVASDDDAVIAEHADAVLIALPNNLHAETAVRMAERGLHLLVEKPLAVSTGECDRVIAEARRQGVVLGLAMDRRFGPQYLAAKEMIDGGRLGTVTGIEIAESSTRPWPSVSGFNFDPAKVGGGVLINNGIHALDQVMWWFGDPALIDYADDQLGGLETECKLALEFDGRVTASLFFSRLRRLPNKTIIHGENGTIEVDAYQPRLRYSGGGLGGGDEDAATSLAQADPGALWRDWARAVLDGGQPSASGDDGRRAVTLIEQCYGTRKRLPLPWVFPDTRRGEPAAATGASAIAAAPGREETPRDRPTLDDSTILVTGGSGFIGGRVIEMARLHHDARVRVLTRVPHRARRAARTAVDIVAGDIADPAAVRAAAEGVDIIVHCAWGNGSQEEQRAGTVDGTRNVMEAAVAAGVSRVVHFSTMAVYGAPDADLLDETMPHRPMPHTYAQTKTEAEAIVWQAHATHGVPVVVLQPTIVYGPYGGFWTTGQIEKLSQSPLALPSGLDGICQIVYVDDVAQAAMLAATNDEAVGHAFLISGPDQVTWRQYYEAFGRLIGRPVTFDLSPLEIRAWRSVMKRHWAHQSLRVVNRLWPRVLDSSRFRMPSKGQIERIRVRPRVSSDKARSILGYRPVFDFARGMELTTEWAVAAGLVGKDQA